MPKTSARTFTVTAANEMDGDCFEVAERAVRQAGAIARVLALVLAEAQSMTLNAEMHRQLLATGECDVDAANGAASERKIQALTTLAVQLEKQLEGIARAAGYNPKQSLLS